MPELRGRALVALPRPGRFDRIRQRVRQTDLVPDLGTRIGSAEWWRGAATCTGLVAATLMLAPGLERPIYGAAPAKLTGRAWDEARAQSIAPLALGATTGRRMAATSLVRPLTDTPERPTLELSATLGDDDGVQNVLERAGVSGREASNVARLVAGAVALGDLRPGTQFDIALGRRADKNVARPLERLAFRARFDLALAVAREGGTLSLIRRPIAIDRTPLRIRGLAGASLYRAARAAGAPAKAVEMYLKAIATRLPVSSVGARDSFDLIIEQARAATGEVQLGGLLFAGLDRGGRQVQLLRWEDAGKPGWFESSGIGERHEGVAAMPVMGHITSTFGVRRHPLLGYLRMHKGIDIGAPYGTPIHAAMDGLVAVAGRASGYGNFVKLVHGAGLATGYGHMSRIAVRPGTHVSRGQVIGYVGSTGMSTGPHLHYELWRNGAAVNPAGISVATVQQLGGDSLRAFKARLASLMALPGGGGLPTRPAPVIRTAMTANVGGRIGGSR